MSVSLRSCTFYSLRGNEPNFGSMQNLRFRILEAQGFIRHAFLRERSAQTFLI